MGAIDQYIDLWQEHGALIDSNAPGAINRLRPAAASSLIENGLPSLKDEDYRHTDFEKILSPDFGVNVARVRIEVNPSETFRCDVPMLTTSLFLVVNDSFAETSGCRRLLPEGVEVMSLAAYARNNPEFIEEHYGRLADISNPTVALNTLLCQDGVVIRVRKGVKVEPTIQIVNIFNSSASLLAARRVLVVMEEDSEAKVLFCDHTQTPDVDFCSVQVIEVFAGERSRLDFYDLEESTRRTSRLSSLWMRQDAGSEVLLDSMTLYNGTTRNEFFTRFAGRHARLRMLGMGIEDDCRRLDTYSRISHDVPECNTDELFKYVVDGEAMGAFAGLIYVAEGAVKTEAFQSNRNLVGSESARMHSKPQLEIYNDDVKCSHGTAIGQLDEKQLFYMMTRGISEEQARFMLKQAFMSDVIDGISLPPLRDRLKLMVERRFAGEQTACASCPVSCNDQIKD
ncbi:MAG: SufD family Fe-S cluster assembly protein [Muribaculaceae bacterium]|nr:SufD family Fe-S cluster assembly protein [Muribaculaceae bacterium]